MAVTTQTPALRLNTPAERRAAIWNARRKRAAPLIPDSQPKPLRTFTALTTSVKVRTTHQESKCSGSTAKPTETDTKPAGPAKKPAASRIVKTVKVKRFAPTDIAAKKKFIQICGFFVKQAEERGTTTGFRHEVYARYHRQWPLPIAPLAQLEALLEDSKTRIRRDLFWAGLSAGPEIVPKFKWELLFAMGPVEFNLYTSSLYLRFMQKQQRIRSGYMPLIVRAPTKEVIDLTDLPESGDSTSESDSDEDI